METWVQRIFLNFCFLLKKNSQSLLCILTLAAFFPGQAYAQTVEDRVDVIEPDIERRDIDVNQVDAQDFEFSVYYGILSIEDFGSDSVYGVRGAYHITEDFFFEASYGLSEAGKTSFEILSGSAQLLTKKERDFKYYNVSIAYNLLPGETFILGRAFNTAFYVIGGLGNTEFGGDDHFTLNFGVGYRMLLKDWLALHVDVRDHLFDSDLLGTSKTVHNIELSAGFSVFF